MEVKILFWVLEFCDYILSDIVMSPRLENSPISFITQEVPWRLANSKKKNRGHCSQRTLECSSSRDEKERHGVYLPQEHDLTKTSFTLGRHSLTVVMRRDRRKKLSFLLKFSLTEMVAIDSGK